MKVSLYTLWGVVLIYEFKGVLLSSFYLRLNFVVYLLLEFSEKW